MRIEVELPSMGEDANEEATVAVWLVQPGEKVAEGDDLVELTTDKASFSVPSPAAGELAEIVAQEGDDIRAGQVLCTLTA